MEDIEKVIEYLKKEGIWDKLKDEKSPWCGIIPGDVINLIMNYKV